MRRPNRPGDQDSAAPRPGGCPASALRAAWDLSAEAMLLVAPSGMRVLDANRAACRLLGRSRRDLRRAEWNEILQTPAASSASVEAVFEGNRRRSSARLVCRTAGGESPHDATLERIEAAGQPLVAVVLRPGPRRRPQTEQAPGTDTLTGLAVRGALEPRLAAALRRRRPCALFFLDLDGFKVINDQYGHMVGDRVLSEVGRRLRACIRPADLAVRYGGDEFALLLPGVAGPEQFTPVARRILERMQDPIVEGQRLVVTASIGIALSGDGYPDGTAMLHAADRAMYEAKRLGRGRFALAGPRSNPGQASGGAS